VLGMKNTCAIESEYGAVMLETSAQTGDVNIKSNKSNITLQTKGKSVHNFDLKSAYGTLQLPEKWAFQLTQPNAHTQTAHLQNGSNRKGILVDANFGKIIVR
jgi:Putative adhesin